MIILNFFFIALVAFVSSQTPRNEITQLPGWKSPLPSRMWSGLIDSGFSNNIPPGPMYMHYWFIESEGNPKTVFPIKFFDKMTIFLIFRCVCLECLIFDFENSISQYNTTNIIFSYFHRILLFFGLMGAQVHQVYLGCLLN